MKQQNYDHLISLYLIACAFVYILGCAGQACGSYEPGCSPNGNCNCFETLDGNGICDASAGDCSALIPNGCLDCPTATHACVIDSCCKLPIYVPRTDECPPPGAPQAANLFKPNVLVKRVRCNEDKDCDSGKSCILQPAGRFCA